MLSFSLTGQTNDTIPVPLANIKRANEIYISTSHKVETLQGLLQIQEKQAEALSLAYDQCMQGFQNERQITAIMSLQMEEQRGIIRSQRTMIRILAGVATTAIGYTIYREVK